MSTLLVVDVSNMFHESLNIHKQKVDYDKVFDLLSEFKITRRIAYGDNFGTFVHYLKHMRFKSYQHTQYYTKMVVDTISCMEHFTNLVMLGNNPSNAFIFEAAVARGLTVYSVGFNLPKIFYTNSEMIQLDEVHTTKPLDMPTDVFSGILEAPTIVSVA